MFQETLVSVYKVFINCTKHTCSRKLTLFDRQCTCTYVKKVTCTNDLAEMC